MITTSQPGYIVFYDDNNSHTYYYIVENSRKKFTSVTTVIKSYFEPFRPNEMAEKVAAAQHHKDETKEEILASWKIANESGSKLHKNIENYLQGKGNEFQHEDFHRFLQFWNTFNPIQKGYTCFAEYQVFDLDIEISGTIDCLLVLPDGRFIILDWKRSRNLRLYGFPDRETGEVRMGKKPFDNFQDCNYSHYSLQLNFYRTILEKKYQVYGRPMVCIGMILVVFQPGEEKKLYDLYNVPCIDLRSHWSTIVKKQ